METRDNPFDLGIARVVQPTVVTPLAPRTAAGNGWDADATGTALVTKEEIAIPSGTEFLHVRLNQPAYIVPSNVLTDPATDGVVYDAGITHVIPCRGYSYLHYKNFTAGANVTVTATAFGN